MGEQCIVSRPGVSSIAGALAAELFVSHVQLKYSCKTSQCEYLLNMIFYLEMVLRQLMVIV